MKKNKCLILLLLVFIVSVSSAEVLVYVDAGGPNNPGSGSFEDPFRKIQPAIEAAANGDSVVIMPGIYTADANNYNLDPNGKSITIRSINPQDANIVATTIIDPNGSGRGFYIHKGEDANCVISGLTIRNGLAVGDSGGGIYFSGSSRAVVENCVISDNTASLHGGGVYCYGSSPVIRNSTIRGNQAIDGGGFECGGFSVPEIKNCVIVNNQASGMGGGVDCYGYSGAVLTNCTLSGNSANSGGALSCCKGRSKTAAGGGAE